MYRSAPLLCVSLTNVLDMISVFLQTLVVCLGVAKSMENQTSYLFHFPH